MGFQARCKNIYMSAKVLRNLLNLDELITDRIIGTFVRNCRLERLTRKVRENLRSFVFKIAKDIWKDSSISMEQRALRARSFRYEGV